MKTLLILGHWKDRLIGRISLAKGNIRKKDRLIDRISLETVTATESRDNGQDNLDEKSY